MTDADTIANAELLWKLVHLVQDSFGKDGEALVVDESGSSKPTRAAIRALADEIDPEYGRY
jgi:hypothetical protein